MRVDYYVEGPMVICTPANDTLGRIRALTATDVKSLLRKRLLVLGTSFDQFAKHDEYRNNPIKAAAITLETFIDLQHEIVWRGTRLARGL